MWKEISDSSADQSDSFEDEHLFSEKNEKSPVSSSAEFEVLWLKERLSDAIEEDKAEDKSDSGNVNSDEVKEISNKSSTEIQDPINSPTCSLKNPEDSLETFFNEASNEKGDDVEKLDEEADSLEAFFKIKSDEAKANEAAVIAADTEDKDSKLIEVIADKLDDDVIGEDDNEDQYYNEGADQFNEETMNDAVVNSLEDAVKEAVDMGVGIVNEVIDVAESIVDEGLNIFEDDSEKKDKESKVELIDKAVDETFGENSGKIPENADDVADVFVRNKIETIEVEMEDSDDDLNDIDVEFENEAARKNPKSDEAQDEDLKESKKYIPGVEMSGGLLTKLKNIFNYLSD